MQGLHGQADHPDLTHSLNNLGFLLGAGNAGAVSCRDPAVALRRGPAFAWPGRPPRPGRLGNLGSLFQAQGRYTEAEPFLRDTLAMRRACMAADHPALALSLNNLGRLLQAQGKYAEAELLRRESCCCPTLRETPTIPT